MVNVKAAKDTYRNQHVESASHLDEASSSAHILMFAGEPRDLRCRFQKGLRDIDSESVHGRHLSLSLSPSSSFSSSSPLHTLKLKLYLGHYTCSVWWLSVADRFLRTLYRGDHHGKFKSIRVATSSDQVSGRENARSHRANLKDQRRYVRSLTSPI